jgi:glycosyltransferase involved in cell wall biosynthesis
MTTRVAIIIPARNESRRIGGLVRALCETSEIVHKIVVSCNGCVDGTAHAARAAARGDPRVVILETEVASKTGAIRAGEAILAAESDESVRFYIDADVTVEARAIEGLALRLGDAGARVGSLRLCVRTDHCSVLARLAARGWMRTRYFRSAPVQCVIAVNRTGRSRWRQFPDVIGDDIFITSKFAADEVVISNDYATIDWPTTAAGVLRTYIRWRLGTIEAKYQGSRPTPRDSPPLRNLKLCDLAHAAFQIAARTALLVGYRPKSWYSPSR